MSEVIGKRLQNFVVLFPEVCDGGRVKVLSKLYLLVKMFVLEFLHCLPHRTVS